MGVQASADCSLAMTLSSECADQCDQSNVQVQKTTHVRGVLVSLVPKERTQWEFKTPQWTMIQEWWIPNLRDK